MPAPNMIEILEAVHFEGYLEKQRKFSTWAWNRYWFTIEDGQLNYYKDNTCTEGVGLIDLGQAISIKPINNVPRNHPFEITMKDRNHVFCADSEMLKEKWVRLLQQARFLRPKRSSSMMRPRCNSVAEVCTPDDILSIEDLEPPNTPTSPPGTPSSLASSASPWSSPPNTPTSPLKLGSPKFQKGANSPLTNSPKFQKATPKAPNSPLTNSPKFQKAMPKAPHSPKGREFLDSPAWIKGKVVPSSSSSEQVLLKGIRRLKSESATSALAQEPEVQLSEQTYAIRANSVFYVSYPDETENIKPPVTTKSKSNHVTTKAPVMAAKSNKIPVTRVITRPITSLVSNNNNTINGFTKSSDQQPVSRTISKHAVVTRAYTSRPVSQPAQITRARPVTGERPVIENRISAFKPHSVSTSSNDSDSESSSRKLKRLAGTGSNDSSRVLIPSKSSTGGVVLRHNVRSVKSVPLKTLDGSDIDSDTDKEDGGEDEVFMPSPVATSSPMYRLAPQVMDDEYYEKLNKLIRQPRPPIPMLPFPRLELTFRSAFDDIRLFLANNRDDDEIFPVPRKSERGGKAIKKLKKFLHMVS